MNIKILNKLTLIFVIALNLLYLPLPNSNSESNLLIHDVSSLMKNNLKTSQISNKIFINGTSDWIDFRNAGNCTGSGTYSDPYIIEDLIIDGGGSGSCIHIENSSVFFRIENCTVLNSGSNGNILPGAGIKLYNVSNGLIQKNNLYYNFVGIILKASNCTISQNVITNNIIGIMSFDENILIYNNSIYNNYQYGIFVGFNCTVFENSITNNMIGIYGFGYLNISLNNVSFNKIHGIWIHLGYNNSITDNFINNNNGTGILCTASYTEIVRNEINNNQVSGIDVVNSTTVEVFNNEINENYYGIKMRESSGCNILQNTINYNHYGVYLNTSDGNSILHNTLHYNWICYFKTDDSFGNHYQDNDCIETKKRGFEQLLPIILGIIILSAALGIAIFLYARIKSE